jgi:hypothetical protein
VDRALEYVWNTSLQLFQAVTHLKWPDGGVFIALTKDISRCSNGQKICLNRLNRSIDRFNWSPHNALTELFGQAVQGSH